jgi:hypothetical protein
MAVRDFEAFIRQKATIFDPNLDVDPGSPFDVQVTQPVVRRIGPDPFTVDLSTFINDRLRQAFPELATKEGDALADLLNKPASLLWDPIVREIKRVRLGLSFRDTSLLTIEEAEALGANLFSERRRGEFSRGVARVFFTQAQNIAVSPINFATDRTGLHYFPTEIQSIRTEEMLLNVSDDGLFYFDINVIAEAAGDSYNIEPNSLVSIANVSAAVRVGNPRRFSFGEDEDTAQEYIDRAKGELTERSLVTLRGISAKVTKSFPEVRRLNVVGFNDPEMQRDIIKGGGLGPAISAGIRGFVGDDTEGQVLSRRFSTTEIDFVSVVGPTTVTPEVFVLSVFEAFNDGDVVKDLKVLRVVDANTIDVGEQVLVPGLGGIPAKGRISTIPKASLVDGQTFTLNDGTNPAKVFEFDTNSTVTLGNVAVNISVAVTADDVRDAIILAVNSVTVTLSITASSGGPARVDLINDESGVQGNVVITETVTNAGFTVDGMSGGIGGEGLRWTLRKNELTLSGIPGGILFPNSPQGDVVIEGDEVHIGGMTDVYVRASGFNESTLVLDNVADDEPEASGTMVISETSGPDTVFRLDDYTLDVNYVPADEIYKLFTLAGREGMTIQVLEGTSAGVYRIISITQVSGQTPVVLTDPQPSTVSSIEARWKISNEINVDLISPKETKISGSDLTTVQNSDIVSTLGGIDFDVLGVAENDILRIANGPDAGDYRVVQDPIAPSFITLQVDKPLTSTTSGVVYSIFRANAGGGLLRPLVRVTKVELLDSSKQSLGSIVPYAKPIDIQSRAFQNPSRGVKHTFRDVRLGVVSGTSGLVATGTITTLPAASILDTETFTINDGTNAPVVFEFDKNGSITPGNTAVNIAAAVTTSDVRDAIISAVNGVGSALFVTASDGGTSTVNLVNDQKGSVGNQTITETVFNAGFIVTGMSGGANDVYALGAADTLLLGYINFEGLLPLQVEFLVTFTAGPLSRLKVIEQINSAILFNLGVLGGAVEVGEDRFGLKPLKRGSYIRSGTAIPALFGNNELQTGWDVRSDSVDTSGGWGSLNPPIDLISGLDVVQVITGNQVGFRAGPFFLNTQSFGVDASTALVTADITTLYLGLVAPFAPESGVDIQMGSRSIGSVRCFFLDPTSIEFDRDTRFLLETDSGDLRFLPDPTLSFVKIPAKPGGSKPSDGSITGGSDSMTSVSQDFVRSGVRGGDSLVVDFIPITGTVSLADPISNLVGKTLIYSIDDGPNRTLTFINDDSTIPVTSVTRDGAVAQINTSVGLDIAQLDASNRLEFEADGSISIRKIGTANTALLSNRLGLPVSPQYSFSSSDQSNDSPHAGRYTIVSVLPTTLDVLPNFSSSGDYSNPVTRQGFSIERIGAQRISTTEMADSVAETSLYFFDVELVSEGTGDVYNIEAMEQLSVEHYLSDGWFLTTDDPNLTFSPVESVKMVISKSILERGVDDDPINATNISGQNVQINYEYTQLVDDVNSFITSEIDRVVCSNPLGRHLIPHFVRYDFNYQGGSSEDVVKAAHERYIRDLFPSDALEVSDLGKIASDRGATSITNPIDLIAVVYGVDRSIKVARSQNSLTTGRLAAFIPDVLNIVRNVT